MHDWRRAWRRRSARCPSRYLGRRAGLRRHLPRPAGRHRPQLGGPLHARSAPACAPGPRKREPDVVIGTDAETWLQLRAGRAVRRRGVLASAASTPAATSTSPSASRACSACPSGRPPLLRIHDVPVGRLKLSHADDGRGPGRPAPARPRRRPSRASSTPRPRSAGRYRVHAIDLPGLRRLEQAGHRALRRARSPHARSSARWTRSGIEPRPPRRQLDGRARGASRSASQRPDRVGGLALLVPRRRVRHAATGTGSCASLRPELGLLPHSLGRGADRAAVLGAVRRPRPRRPERGRHRRRRVRAHLPLAGARAGLPRLAPAAIYLEAPVRPQGLLPAAGRAASRRRCSCGPRTTG